MSTLKFTALAIVGILSMALPAQAQEEKKDAAAPAPHCSPRIGELCDMLNSFAQTGGETWKIGIYGSTACSNSRSIQNERRVRRDRLEYDARLAKAAKDKKQDFKPWVPAESTEQFTARTNSQCDGSYAYYCGEMKKEADGLKSADEREKSLAFVDSACAAQTAASTPAAVKK